MFLDILVSVLLIWLLSEEPHELIWKDHVAVNRD